MVSRSLFIGLKLRAGVPKASSFRGHSLRRGGASWAFNTGVPGELIQILGVWSSEAWNCIWSCTNSSWPLTVLSYDHSSFVYLILSLLFEFGGRRGLL